MSADFEDRPYSDSHLDSPEYRKRLRRKLNTLIAVLEVACAKVRRSLAGPDPDLERLNRIHKNLKDTLQVCRRARKALDRCEKLPDDLPDEPQERGRARQISLPQGGPAVATIPRAIDDPTSEAEASNASSKLGPIDPRGAPFGVDLDDLCRQLLD